MGHLDLKKLNHTPGKSDLPSHAPGTSRGEGWVRKRGREPGRNDPKGGRTARDSTGINAGKHGPALPIMPSIPPA